MASVFISYRQQSAVHRQQVRQLGEALRDAGIEVVLDQFLLDVHPAGPDETWPAWSERQAAAAKKVLVIASSGWFRCYAGTEAPGEGLGAAAEAHVIKQRLYNAAFVNSIFRIVVLAPADATGIPTQLQGYHYLETPGDLPAIIAWITDRVPPPTVKPSPSTWPVSPPAFDWEPANCEPVRVAFTQLLAFDTPHRVLMVRGSTETGKSYLTNYLLDLALKCNGLGCGRFDMKAGADLDVEFSCLVAHLDVDEAVRANAGRRPRERLDAVLAALRSRALPTVLVFDTFEQGGEWARWVEARLLLEVPRATWLRVLIAGQQVPASVGTAWSSFAAPVLELEQLGWEDWFHYGKRYHAILTEDRTKFLHSLTKGKHSLLGRLLGRH